MGSYKETYWENEIDGKLFRLTIEELLRYLDDQRSSVVEVPIPEVQELCIHWGSDDIGTLVRAEASDLKYPLIMLSDRSMLLDGHHRLLKAIREGRESVKVRFLEVDTMPEQWKRMFC
jgi:hypothetical protein